MIVKGIIDEDFINYKKPSMYIAFPYCSWKCDKECGQQVCQNGTLAQSSDIHISLESIVERYMNNDISQAIVMSGLEPFDSWSNLYHLIVNFRCKTQDDIVIYTGYYADEIRSQINKLKEFPNIIIKFGRYIPNQNKHYDKILGVALASNNQYGVKIS